MSSDPSNSPRAFALRYISNTRFHRRFNLPATTDHDTLTVTYADIGSVPEPMNRSTPTILFMPGMFASRYIGVFMHAIAEKLGVRVVIVDRPGMGNTTDVPLHQRVSIWIELVPKLLAHLGIEHVALVSHCAGTLYLLNTLYHCRDLLHPERPFVAFLAPWVDPSHSHVTSMQMAQYLPSTVFGVWNLIPKFFLLKVAPVFASSGMAMTKSSSVMSSGVVGVAEDVSELEKNRRRIERGYGLSRDVQAELDSLVMSFMFEENTVGANSEALQCLRKGSDGWKTWGKCEDYGVYVRAYFAKNDSMIENRGQKYVEECWFGEGGAEEFGDVLDFESATYAELEHDSLLQSAKVLESIFVHAGGIQQNVLE
ncbi:hypothetical protein BBP40_002597 [Aspergillus hancockii]|nr:hypothetical protein BBP40_002597 [Aspergillus hancockii]